MLYGPYNFYAFCSPVPSTIDFWNLAITKFNNNTHLPLRRNLFSHSLGQTWTHIRVPWRALLKAGCWPHPPSFWSSRWAVRCCISNNFSGVAEAAALGTSLCGPLVWAISGTAMAIEGFLRWIWRLDSLFAGARAWGWRGAGHFHQIHILKYFPRGTGFPQAHLISCSLSYMRERPRYQVSNRPPTKFCLLSDISIWYHIYLKLSLTQVLSGSLGTISILSSGRLTLCLSPGLETTVLSSATNTVFLSSWRRRNLKLGTGSPPPPQESPESQTSTDPSPSIICSSLSSMRLWFGMDPPPTGSPFFQAWDSTQDLTANYSFNRNMKCPQQAYRFWWIWGQVFGAVLPSPQDLISFHLPLSSHALLFLTGLTPTQKRKKQVLPLKEGRTMVPPWGNFKIGGCASYNSIWNI